MFMVPLGLQEATCSLVGNSIGANHVQLAKRICKVTFMISFAIILTVTSSVFMGRFRIARALTSDPELILMVAKVIPFLSLFYFPNAAQTYLAGPIRALGLQEEASKLVLVAFYIIGMPSAVLFAFKLHFGIIGFWFGMSLGVTFQSLYFLRILLKTDW